MRLHLSLLFGALGLLLAGGGAQASSAVGTDNHPGNLFAPGGSNTVCYPDETGLNPLARTPSRTPSGFLYRNPCALPEQDQSQESGSDWRTRIIVEVGAFAASGDRKAHYLNKYNDLDRGAALSYLSVNALNSRSGGYVDLYTGSWGRNDPYLSLRGGQHGKYRVEARYNEIRHLLGTGATPLWDGVGTDTLRLPAGMTPGAGSVADILGQLATQPTTDLAVTRKRAGIGAEIKVRPDLRLFANYDYEERTGSRPYGGAFFFAYAIPGFGGINELVEPIDHGTHNFNLGSYLQGERWALNLIYNGSVFRNRNDTLTWDNPFFMPSLAPPPSGGFSAPQGRIDLWPDNQFDSLKADFSLRFGRTGTWTTTASTSRLRQNDPLIPYTISTGIGGTAPDPMNFDQWNTLEALSRRTAEARINNRLLQTKINASPTRNLRLRASIRAWRQDNKTTPFITLNPLTGQYGYVVTDGGLGSTIPFENYLFYPGQPGPDFRYRSIPFEHDKTNLVLGADYRLQRASITGEYERIKIDREFREIPTTIEDELRLIVVYKGWSRGTLRLLGEYSERRFDGQYDSNPYAPFYVSALPGFVSENPSGLPTDPHTLASLVKYDIDERDKSTLEARLNVLLNDRTDGFVSVQYHENDYKAPHGLTARRGWLVNTQMSYMPGTDGTWYTHASWQQSDLDQANINDANAGLGPDPNPGGPTYPWENEWRVKHEERSFLFGLGHARMLGPTKLTVDYYYSSTVTDLRQSYASLGALSAPDPDLIAYSRGGFPALSFKRHIAEARLDWPLRPDLDLRFYYRYEDGSIDDFHYDGLEMAVPGRNALYLGLGADNWKAHFFGAFLQYRFR